MEVIFSSLLTVGKFWGTSFILMQQPGIRIASSILVLSNLHTSCPSSHTAWWCHASLAPVLSFWLWHQRDMRFIIHNPDHWLSLNISFNQVRISTLPPSFGCARSLKIVSVTFPKSQVTDDNDTQKQGVCSMYGTSKGLGPQWYQRWINILKSAGLVCVIGPSTNGGTC